jgi:hypothetical protein
MLDEKIELLLFYPRSIYISHLSYFRPSYMRFKTWSLAKFWCSWPELRNDRMGIPNIDDREFCGYMPAKFWHSWPELKNDCMGILNVDAGRFHFQ